MRQMLGRFAALAAVVLLLWPLTPQAQKMVTVGVLSPAAGRNPLSDVFERSLQELGWRRNQNLRIEERYWGGKPDALGPLAAELVAMGVDVLVTWSPPGALAAKQATSKIPVVFLAAADPVRLGLVTSLARPGGNATGISFDVTAEISAKRLELLKHAVPGVTRIAIIFPSDNSPPADMRTILAAASRSLKVETLEVEVRNPAELEAALKRAKSQGANGLYVWANNPFAFGRQLSEITIAHRLPSVHLFRESAMAGGMLSYAPSLAETARRGATYVDKILRGAKPAEIPVELPTKFELVVNLKTAKALGITIPQSLLLQAEQVIE